jgi:uncharacterized membrane protein
MDKKMLAIFIFSIAGLAFAGYLTLGSIISGACPISGECPYFLGIPACDYGLVMYLLIFVAALAALKTKYDPKALIKIIFFVSLIGIIFSGYFSYVEIINPRTYALILPTCVIGLIMYLAIFFLDFLLMRKKA